MTALLDSETMPVVDGRLLMLCRRAFHADGQDRVIGEVVDTASWPNADALIATRFLVPFTGSPVERSGRLWRDQATADRRAPRRGRRKVES